MSDTLRQLAKRIAEGPDADRVIITYPCIGGGVCHGEGLFVEPPGATALAPGGAVQVCRMDAGQAFAPHQQDYGVTETLCVLCGILTVTTFAEDGETVKREVVLAPGDSFRLWPGELHQAAARTEVVVIGITVPRDGGYPDAPKRHDAGDVR
jgi:tellurite resistance-related uncharacterized protein